jgi:hypothetical protein
MERHRPRNAASVDRAHGRARSSGRDAASMAQTSLDSQAWLPSTGRFRPDRRIINAPC